MSMKGGVVFCTLMVVLGGCTAANHGTPQPSEVPSLPAAAATPTVEIGPPPSLTPVSFSLVTSTDPFVNATGLLDGVCFEFLLTMGGQGWTWTTPNDLAAFYDRVDASELCPHPAARHEFDFSQGVLVGIVNTATGCDAAHRVIDRVQDDAARTQSLRVRFDVQPGCPYELVQPLIVVAPFPPEGYTIQIVIL
jgi:hypothetical protein